MKHLTTGEVTSPLRWVFFVIGVWGEMSLKYLINYSLYYKRFINVLISAHLRKMRKSCLKMKVVIEALCVVKVYKRNGLSELSRKKKST